MATSDLIPLNRRSKEEALAIQTAGGLVKSEAKSVANMTKNLKSGKYARKFTQQVAELSKSPEKSAFKIFGLIEQIQDDWPHLTPKLRMDLARLYCEAHRTIHGSKQLNVNLNSEIKQDLEKWFKDENNKQS